MLSSLHNIPIPSPASLSPCLHRRIFRSSITQRSSDRGSTNESLECLRLRIIDAKIPSRKDRLRKDLGFPPFHGIESDNTKRKRTALK